MVQKCPLKPASLGSFVEQRTGVCGWEEACVRWPSCTGNANTALGSTGGSSTGGPSPAITSGGKYCDSGALLCTSGGGESGGSFSTPTLSPSKAYRFFSSCHFSSTNCQGSGKWVGTQKGSVPRQRLCGLLCSLSYPSPAAFPWESCSPSSVLFPMSIASMCSHTDEFLSVTWATQAIACCLSHGGKV